MKTHPKTFEDIFTSDKTVKKFDPDNIVLPGVMSFDQYSMLMRNTIKNHYSDLFDFYVRVSWLKRNFRYKGVKIKNSANGIWIDQNFSVFMKNYVGSDIKLITQSFAFGKVESYFDEIFPWFSDGNPFENPSLYISPFKHITIDFMTVVYQMPDRMEILKMAEDKKMTYAEFLDFMINHTMSENESTGTDRYEFILSNKCPPYIKDNDKNNE